MDPSAAWHAILANDTPLAALVAGRIYPVELPQGMRDPSVTYRDTSAVGRAHYEGPSNPAEVRLTVIAWAETATASKAIGEAIRKALDGFAGLVEFGEASPLDVLQVQGIFFNNAVDLFDEIAGMHYRVTDFLAFYRNE